MFVSQFQIKGTLYFCMMCHKAQGLGFNLHTTMLPVMHTKRSVKLQHLEYDNLYGQNNSCLNDLHISCLVGFIWLVICKYSKDVTSNNKVFSYGNTLA